MIDAGAKLVAVCDSKSLQPINAGGIFKSLTERHGKAELSNIQRQKTDLAPLLDWLCERESLSQARGAALQSLPENVRLQTPGSFCAKDEKLGWAFARWRIRFDFEWLREVAQLSAVGQDKAALQILDDKDQLKLVSVHTATVDAMTCDWAADRRVIERKTMIDFRHIYGNIHSLLNNQTIFWCVLKASIRLACHQCSRFHIAYTEDTRI